MQRTSSSLPGLAGQARRAAPAPHAAQDHATRRRLDDIARLLDSRWRLPGTGVTFGADAILNLIPGLGTVATTGISAYLILQARRMGAPPSLLLRMAGNVGLDTLISSVPVLGWAGDVFFRANTRNMALLRRHLDRRG